MLKKILSKDTKTIVLSLIPIVLSLFMLFSNNIISILLGITIFISTVFYLVTDNIKSPLLLFVTLILILFLSNYLLLNLDYKYINSLSVILFLELFIYFAVLSIGYLFETKNRGLFILSFIIDIIYLVVSYLILINDLIPIDKIKLFEVVFAIILVIFVFVVLKIKGDKDESIYTTKS